MPVCYSCMCLHVPAGLRLNETKDFDLQRRVDDNEIYKNVMTNFGPDL
jgi:hypothetical protein